MDEIGNPIVALIDMQNAIDNNIPLQLTDLADNYKFRYDNMAPDQQRLFLAKVAAGKVQSITIFGLERPINGKVCFSVFYAVEEQNRNKGLAVEGFNVGLNQLKLHLSQTTNLQEFYVDAVIDKNNTPSLAVARKIFDSPPTSILETYSNKPAFHFKRLFRTK
jgi:hypothetical protein